MNIDLIINKIIPPSDREHRDGFDNTVYIDELNDYEKAQLEYKLIAMLSNAIDLDYLVVESLEYLKSDKALAELYKKLADDLSSMDILVLASSIFMIINDNEMINLAISSFKKMDNPADPYYKYKLISGFYYLSKFSAPATNDVIKSYINHEDYLVSYNARRYYNRMVS